MFQHKKSFLRGKHFEATCLVHGPKKGKNNPSSLEGKLIVQRLNKFIYTRKNAIFLLFSWLEGLTAKWSQQDVPCCSKSNSSKS